MYRQLYKKLTNAVFMIAKRTEDNLQFLGSGFLASNKGHILTCSHILSPLDSLFAIQVGNGNNYNPITMQEVTGLKLNLVQNNTMNDVSLLQIDSKDSKITFNDNLFGNADNIECGSSIGTIGFPFGFQGLHVQSITHGIISAKVIDSNSTKLLQFDCMIHEGNSGGPLIDLSSSKIIGIVTNRFNPMPGNAGIMIGNRRLGVETNISYATAIEYGIELLNNEK